MEKKNNSGRTGRGNVTLRTPKKYQSRDVDRTEMGYRRATPNDEEIRNDSATRVKRSTGSAASRGTAGARRSAGYRESLKHGHTASGEYRANRKGEAQKAYERRNLTLIEEGDDSFEQRRRARALRRKKREENERELWRWIIFGGFLAIYICVLFYCSIRFLHYTDNCLKYYELSQSIYAMESYFDEYSQSIAKGEMPKDVDLSACTNPFDSIDYVNERFLAEMKTKKLTFEKAKDSYLTESPVYVIYADGEELTRVSFEGENPKVILKILTLLQWKVSKVETSYTMEGSHNYTFTVPYGYTVVLDGVPLSSEYLTEETETVAEFTYAKEYSDVRDNQIYRVNGVSKDLTVTCLARDGETPVEIVADGYNYRAEFVPKTECSEERRQYSLTAAEQWSLLMTNDLGGEYNGFVSLAPYLVAGSYYYQMAYEFATGVDITFMSPHTLYDPAFQNIVIDDYKEYSDRCYTVHIAFDQMMHLTVTGTEAVNHTDSIFTFVYYDDSEDGVDNPHWAIIDMTTTGK